MYFPYFYISTSYQFLDGMLPQKLASNNEWNDKSRTKITRQNLLVFPKKRRASKLPQYDDSATELWPQATSFSYFWKFLVVSRVLLSCWSFRCLGGCGNKGHRFTMGLYNDLWRKDGLKPCKLSNLWANFLKNTSKCIEWLIKVILCIW